MHRVLYFLIAFSLIGLPTSSANATRPCLVLCPVPLQVFFPNTIVGSTSSVTVSFVSNPLFAGQVFAVNYRPGLDVGATNQGVSVDVADSTCFSLHLWPSGGAGCDVVLTWTPLRAGRMSAASLYLGNAELLVLNEDGEVDPSLSHSVNSNPTDLQGLAMEPAPAAPAFSLSSTSESTTAGLAISGYSINSIGGAIDTFAITPAIGNGLIFSTSTGLISGTPSTAAAAITYTITGTNVSGTTTATYAITVNPRTVIAPLPVPVPDPVQQSKILTISTKIAPFNTATPIVVTGNFTEKISAIQVNGVGLSAGSWVQTIETVAFIFQAKPAGIFSIQLFNGSVPVLAEQKVTVIPAPALASISPSILRLKVTYIQCVKPGHGTRIVYGVNPICPNGLVKK